MLQQSTHRSLPQHGCLIKEYRQRDSEPHLPKEELEPSHSLSPGFAREMALPQPSHIGWSMSNMSESAWIYWHSPHLGETAKHVGSRGEKSRVDNQNLVIVIICKLSLLQPSLMEYEMGDTLSPVNQHSTWPGWHHVWYPRSASQDNVSSNNGLNWDLGR